MLYNYFKIAYRNFIKNPIFSAINVGGLSLSIAAFILILQYVSFEVSVNTFHKNLPDLYRVLFETKEGQVYDYSAPIIGTLAKQQFGEVDKYCRVAEGIGNGIVKVGENANLKTFKEEHIAYADGSFFDMFSFSIQEGNGLKIKETNTVAISSSTAKKYFNQQNALGNVLTVNNEFGENLYTIVAVFNDFPQNSDLRFDIILSLQTLANPANLHGADWANLDGTSSYLTTFLQLQPKADFKLLEAHVNEFKKKVDPDDEDAIRLQPMKNIHLAASLNDHYISYGNLGFLYLIGGIALLIVVIAWFNYINLSTAGALKRAKEVGIRKVIGASKQQLVLQFLRESFFLNIVALLLAFAIVNIGQPVFNEIIGKPLSFSLLTQNAFWIFGSMIFIFGSVASGGYAAFVLSSFKPSQTLKGIFSKSSTGIALRKTLVVFQFSISILLIAATFILYQQLQFVQNQNLGMNLNQLVVINGPEVGKDNTYTQRKESFKNELTQASFVEKYSGSGSVPTQGYNYSNSGITKMNALPGEEKNNYNISFIDDHFFDTYEINFEAGQNFTYADCNKKQSEVDRLILNEQAARQLGFQSPQEAIGSKIKWYEKEYEIKGIVKDYHHLSLRQTIAPIIYIPQFNSGFFTVKLKPGNTQAELISLEKIYKEYFPGNPFEYFFVNENYFNQYRAEQQYGKIFTATSCLAIFVACLGLFGLATFTVEQRTKEIGIRKVMGASISQISILLSRDFLKLVVISILIASPLAWWAMHTWLQAFAYRVEITIWIFALAGALAIFIALLTVGSRAIQAAMSNPVKSLRSE